MALDEIIRYVNWCRRLVFENEIESAWVILKIAVRSIVQYLEVHMKKNEEKGTPGDMMLYRKLLITSVFGLMMLSKCWSVKRHAEWSVLRLTLTKVFPSYKYLMTLTETEAIINAAMQSNPAEMERWEEMEFNPDTDRELGRVYRIEKRKHLRDPTAPAPILLMSDCVADMCLVKMGLSPVTYASLSREEDGADTIYSAGTTDEDYEDYEDFGDAGNEEDSDDNNNYGDTNSDSDTTDGCGGCGEEGSSVSRVKVKEDKPEDKEKEKEQGEHGEEHEKKHKHKHKHKHKRKKNKGKDEDKSKGSDGNSVSASMNVSREEEIEVEVEEEEEEEDNNETSDKKTKKETSKKNKKKKKKKKTKTRKEEEEEEDRGKKKKKEKKQKKKSKKVEQGEVPIDEVRTLRGRVQVLTELYPLLDPVSPVKAKVTFVLGMYERARGNLAEAESLLFESVYVINSLSELLPGLGVFLTRMALRTLVMYGDVLMKNSKYQYANACYEAATTLYKEVDTKEYYMIARRSAEMAHTNNDLERCIDTYGKLYGVYMANGRTNEAMYVLNILIRLYKEVGDYAGAEAAVQCAFRVLTTAGPARGGTLDSEQQLLDLRIQYCAMQLKSGLLGNGFYTLSDLYASRITQRSKRAAVRLLAAKAFAEKGLFSETNRFLLELAQESVPAHGRGGGGGGVSGGININTLPSPRPPFAVSSSSSSSSQSPTREESCTPSPAISPAKAMPPAGRRDYQCTSRSTVQTSWLGTSPPADTVPAVTIAGSSGATGAAINASFLGTAAGSTTGAGAGASSANGNSAMEENIERIKHMLVLVRALERSEHYAEGIGVIEAAAGLLREGTPGKLTGEVYYQRGVLLHRVYCLGEEGVGYPTKLRASEAYVDSHLAAFGAAIKGTPHQRFGRATDVLQEAAASYLRAQECYQFTENSGLMARTLMSLAELLLDHVFVRKTVLGAAGSSNDNDGGDNVYTIPAFLTRAHDIACVAPLVAGDSRAERRAITLEAIQGVAFRALELTQDSGNIFLHINCLLNIAELRLLQKEREGSYSYWKEAKDLIWLLFMDGPTLVVRSWPRQYLEPIVGWVVRLCKILLCYESETISKNIVVLDACLSAQWDLTSAKQVPVPYNIFPDESFASPGASAAVISASPATAILGIGSAGTTASTPGSNNGSSSSTSTTTTTSSGTSTPDATSVTPAMGPLSLMLGPGSRKTNAGPNFAEPLSARGYGNTSPLLTDLPSSQFALEPCLRSKTLSKGTVMVTALKDGPLSPMSFRQQQHQQLQQQQQQQQQLIPPLQLHTQSQSQAQVQTVTKKSPRKPVMSSVASEAAASSAPQFSIALREGFKTRIDDNGNESAEAPNNESTTIISTAGTTAGKDDSRSGLEYMDGDKYKGAARTILVLLHYLKHRVNDFWEGKITQEAMKRLTTNVILGIVHCTAEVRLRKNSKSNATLSEDEYRDRLEKVYRIEDLEERNMLAAQKLVYVIQIGTIVACFVPWNGRVHYEVIGRNNNSSSSSSSNKKGKTRDKATTPPPPKISIIPPSPLSPQQQPFQQQQQQQQQQQPPLPPPTTLSPPHSQSEGIVMTSTKTTATGSQSATASQQQDESNTSKRERVLKTSTAVGRCDDTLKVQLHFMLDPSEYLELNVLRSVTTEELIDAFCRAFNAGLLIPSDPTFGAQDSGEVRGRKSSMPHFKRLSPKIPFGVSNTTNWSNSGLGSTSTTIPAKSNNNANGSKSSSSSNSSSSSSSSSISSSNGSSRSSGADEVGGTASRTASGTVPKTSRTLPLGSLPQYNFTTLNIPQNVLSAPGITFVGETNGFNISFVCLSRCLQDKRHSSPLINGTLSPRASLPYKLSPRTDDENLGYKLRPKQLSLAQISDSRKKQKRASRGIEQTLPLTATIGSLYNENNTTTTITTAATATANNNDNDSSSSNSSNSNNSDEHFGRAGSGVLKLYICGTSAGEQTVTVGSKPLYISKEMASYTFLKHYKSKLRNPENLANIRAVTSSMTEVFSGIIDLFPRNTPRESSPRKEKQQRVRIFVRNSSNNNNTIGSVRQPVVHSDESPAILLTSPSLTIIPFESFIPGGSVLRYITLLDFYYASQASVKNKNKQQ